MNKTDKDIKNETFLMQKWEDEDFIDNHLAALGFNMEHTTWVYSWTVPAWVPDNSRAALMDRLAASDYRYYLVNVRQETPK